MSTDHTEDLLRETLRSKAGEAYSTVTVEIVRRDAEAARRRSTWRRTALVAAAAAVVVGAPTAVLVRSGSEPRPAPSPVGTPSPTTSATSVLAELPRSSSPGVTYVEGDTIHLATGGTASLPGHTDVDSFAAYRGGWLVGDGRQRAVRWYDNTGTLQRDGIGPYVLAASADGTRLAFSMDSRLRIGISSGMGEGEEEVPITGDPERAWPAGFLSSGALVYNDDGKVKTNQPLDHPLPTEMSQAEAVSVDDLIAGVDTEGREIVWSAATGETVWHGSAWRVADFSQDGRYAAAMKFPDNGTQVVGILDARTGRPLVEHTFNEADLEAISPVMDADDSLLFVGVEARSQDQAVLRLTRAGVVSRASEILRHDDPADRSTIVFATGP